VKELVVSKSKFGEYIRQRHLKKAKELSIALGDTKENFIQRTNSLPAEVFVDCDNTCCQCGGKIIGDTAYQLCSERANNPEELYQLLNAARMEKNHICG